MWLSRNILSRFVNLEGIAPEEIAQKLTMATAEIEAVEYLNAHFKTIVTARLTDVRRHPQADKLTLCDADAGEKKYRVVCGAPNHKTGDIVALATVGTKFNEEFVIKKSKIRGEESEGMLCSEKELGLSDDHSGIMIFPAGTKLGVSLAELFPDWVDVRFEIDNKSITHRPDLWSHAGFAREIGALFGREVRDPVNYSLRSECVSKENLSVNIKNPEAAPRYTGLMVGGIVIAESPQWLKAAVTAIGMRPINNIVDITNYVMVEIGEPMHAFDRRKLRGGEIMVRLAGEGEPLVTLDGSEFKLMTEDIVIADAGGPVALAGVMGGANSEIEPDTSTIVLEAANFNPVNIRKTAQRYNHRTEAAIRFEKSLSPEVTEQAILRCYQLIREMIPGATALTQIVDAYPKKQAPVSISVTTNLIRRRLGEQISDDRITGILKALDFKLSGSGESLVVQVPHYRATKDIAIPEDIVEEVGRIYGYDNISPCPPLVPCVAPPRNEFRLFERKMKNILTMHCDMIEVSNYSFTGEDELNRLKINQEKELRLKNPLSSEQDRLRRSLVPGIVRNVALNQRYRTAFGIYELGRVYLKEDRQSRDLIGENTRITGAFYQKKPGEPVFYYAKNAVMTIMEKLNAAKPQYAPVTENLPPYAHPARAMSVSTGGKVVGLIFELHPRMAAAFDIQGSVGFFDIDASLLFDAPGKEIKFRELQKFPEVPFEISVIADARVYTDDISAIIRKSDNKLVQRVEVVSVYEGAPIPEGKKSVSFKIVFASPEKTLSPEEIDGLQKKVVAEVNKKGYQLR